MPVATPTSLVQLLGFSGDQQNYDESAPHFRWTGHVGLRYRDTPQVWWWVTFGSRANGSSDDLDSRNLKQMIQVGPLESAVKRGDIPKKQGAKGT